MKLVVEIPHNLYESMIKGYALSDLGNSELYKAVQHGTPLPKHHGRLIDADELLDDIGLEDNDENRDCNNGEIITLENIDRISTIIPATKEGAE